MSMPLTATAKTSVIAASHDESAVSILLHRSMKEAERDWLDLEARGTCSPYQRHAWIKCYLDAFAPRGDIHILAIRDNENTVAVAPFIIVRRFGLRVAQIIGMPISNGDGLIFAPGATTRLTAGVLRQAFRVLPADLVNFHCVAPFVDDGPNPLMAFAHTPAPDNFYSNTLQPGDLPYIDQSLPHKRRTNIKRSRRRLVEGFGEVHLRAAQSVEEIDEMLAVFRDQRGKRFVQMGVENIFDKPDFRAFFRDLCVAELGRMRPALRIHALYAGEHIVATSLGAYGAHHYSQYINSTDYGEASRYSLMGVTLSLLVDELRREGITSFDMGLGDFDYKLDWTKRETVYDVVVPNSALGRLAGPALQIARRLKRTIKQTPSLWKFARAIQTARTRARAKR